MEYHRPLLPNGRQAPIAWEIQLFFLNVNWPIKENARKFMVFYEKFIIVAGWLMFCYLNEAEMYYIVQNINDIGLTLEGLATYLILIESHMRIFCIAFKKPEFKAMIDEFFLKIFIENSSSYRQTCRDIQRKLLPTKVCSYFYMLTVLSYFSTVIRGFIQNNRFVPFKSSYHYTFDVWYYYFPTLLANLWIGVAVVSHLAAESNLLATIILHLNARYLLLQHDLMELHNKVLQDKNILRINELTKFRHGLIDIIKRNIEYNAFAVKFQSRYSFTIFVMMALSAVLLCVLGFLAATLGMTPTNITFVCWIIGKIVELMVFGTLGSNIIETTNKLSTSYYSCNWENVVYNSQHAKDNRDLMKLIVLAIELNKKPFSITGFNYFSVSLETVVSILQGAGSYFTFLYAFR